MRLAQLEGLVVRRVSVLGNEASIRLGRHRLVQVAKVLSIAVGGLIEFVGSTGYWIAVGLIVLYGTIIWLDSSSLTAGAAGSADPARRGALLAVHSMLGYAGGFVGPLAIGWTLDLSGGMSSLGWGPVVPGDCCADGARARGLCALAAARLGW